MEISVRHLALEFLVTIVEASPAMCRKMGGGGESAGSIPARAPGADASADFCGGVDAGVGRSSFAEAVFPVCFSMMSELPVRPEFLSTSSYMDI